MLTKISDYPPGLLPPADICIIGSGPAGMEIARNFEGTSHKVTLLESGFDYFNWETQSLGRFIQTGHPIRAADHSHPFDFEQAKKHECLLRQLGGAMNIWGGKWKTLDPVDFEEKDYIAESGWPFSYQEFYPYYEAVAKTYGVTELLNMLKNPVKVPLLPYTHPGLAPSIYIKQVPPPDFILNFKNRVQQSPNIRLILGANATEIRLSNNLKHVNELIVRSIEGCEWNIKANLFILACGTIENARLLLASNKQLPAGLGNEQGLVGRNLLDHPYGNIGELIPFEPGKTIAESNLYQVGTRLIGFTLSLDSSLLREEKLPNHCLIIYSRNTEEVNYPLKYQLEQLPNLESRVTLSEERDALNLPIPSIDWKFKDSDRDGLRRFTEKINGILISQKIGRLSIKEDIYDMKSFADHSHQMGTTRMAKAPRDGVVDPNCQVFGLDNLYIAGASIFPTSGNANPTFTIIALAKKLTNYLKKQK